MAQDDNANHVRSDGYYRWFPGDYMRDTADLSMTEDGAYRRLLDSYYSEESLPSDRARLYRICRATSKEEMKAVDYVSKKFFQEEGDRLINTRAERELRARRTFIMEQTRKAKLGAKARWGDDKVPVGMPPAMPVGIPQAMPQVMPGRCPDDALASASASASGSGPINKQDLDLTATLPPGAPKAPADRSQGGSTPIAFQEAVEQAELPQHVKEQILGKDRGNGKDKGVAKGNIPEFDFLDSIKDPEHRKALTTAATGYATGSMTLTDAMGHIYLTGFPRDLMTDAKAFIQDRKVQA